MNNRQFYVMKFNSLKLKEFDYSLNISLDLCKETNELISLADNQILRTIRNIKNKLISFKEVELLYRERNSLKYKLERNEFEGYEKLNATLNKISDIQKKIDNLLFITEVILVVVNHKSHYKFMFENGFKVNGNTYKRLSCSAGQARVSTVLFCDTKIIYEVQSRLNNGRNKNKKFSPSKFNAYFGLYSSATKIVSEPKFIVIKDFTNHTNFTCNYVTETAENEDDNVKTKKIENIEMNRTDGMGLISPKQAKLWADELELDYIPAQWCIRQSFLKGMLCTFPIHEFCEEINNGSYMVETIYKDKNGDYIKEDLRDYDAIITESQFKLWDSYKSIDEYINNYRKNKLHWGVSQYTPKVLEDILTLNYQFVQTLNLKKEDINALCKKFIDWVQGVSYENWNYMLIFLIGKNITEKKIKNFLQYSYNNWAKCLFINPELKNDKYIRTKLRSLIRTKIQNACLGEIIVDGNFQVLVSDPFAFMQHVCGLKVTGILKDGDFYSNYWNEKQVSKVDAMRSPLTYRSEHVILNLVKNELTEKWYRYCYCGIILNYHGHETVNFAGSDFDYDIVATTSNPQIINSVYNNEYPIVYDVPKPQKINFTKKDLYEADLFSFGSIIGSITNKSSNAYALLPNLEAKYGKESEEYKITVSRLKQCCKAQSAQIDKAKIGKEVKGIPSVWVNYQKSLNTDDESTIKNKTFNNSILINKYPYFFKYRYKKVKKDYEDYKERNNISCLQRFNCSLNELNKLSGKSLEQQDFLKKYDEYAPLIDSKSGVNLICHLIEDTDFNLKQKINANNNVNFIDIYKSRDAKSLDSNQTAMIDKVINLYIKKYKINKTNNLYKFKIHSFEDEQNFLKNITNISTDIDAIVNYLIDYFYIKHTSKNKDILWILFSDVILKNVKDNTPGEINIPIPSESGGIEYLGKIFSLREVNKDWFITNTIR